MMKAGVINMITVEIENVSKSFGDKKVIDDINLKMLDGHTYALLGRNGSGKTTLMNLITTRYLPDSGSIRLIGEEAYENDRVLSDICYMKDFVPVFSDLKPVKIFGMARKHYSRWNEELQHRLTEFFRIDEKSVYGLMSKGQQTAVGLIIGLCSGTRILLFDEIYSGLDAVYRKELYNLIMEEQERYTRTMILTSHLIEEMTNVFTDVIILHNGKVIFTDDIENVQRYSKKLTGRQDIDDLLKGKNILSKAFIGQNIKEIRIYDELGKSEIEELCDRGYKVDNMNLQELFRAMTGEE